MIKFGPSGNSDSFFAAGLSHTEDAAKYVRERAKNFVLPKNTRRFGI